jgi:phosphohistidine phosphatase
MNKQLLIFRHSKSDWGNTEISDFNRPLNTRGSKDAPMMGKRLKKKKWVPDQIISSPALRAFTTANLVCKEIDYPPEDIIQNKSIYEATCNQLMKIVNHLDNKADNIAIFGHNNGITDLVIYLTDADIYNIPTSGMVLISFPFSDWNMISKHTGEVVFYDFPKNSNDNDD